MKPEQVLDIIQRIYPTYKIVLHNDAVCFDFSRDVERIGQIYSDDTWVEHVKDFRPIVEVDLAIKLLTMNRPVKIDQP